MERLVTGLRSRIRKIAFAASLLVGMSGGVWYYNLHASYLALPRVKQAAIGRVYAYHTQGITVFLTKDEQRALYDAQVAALGGFLLALLFKFPERWGF